MNHNLADVVLYKVDGARLSEYCFWRRKDESIFVSWGKIGQSANPHNTYQLCTSSDHEELMVHLETKVRSGFKFCWMKGIDVSGRDQKQLLAAALEFLAKDLHLGKPKPTMTQDKPAKPLPDHYDFQPGVLSPVW